MTLLDCIKCVSEMNLEYALTFCSLHSFEGYFCGMHYVLGTSLDINSQPLRNKQLNHLDGCFFCNALGNKAPNNFTHSNRSNVGFLFIVNVALQKAGAIKLGSWPPLAKVTNLVREFIAPLY